jgi:hypothetical protein
MDTKLVLFGFALVMGCAMMISGCTPDQPLGPDVKVEHPSLEFAVSQRIGESNADERACWGQATQVFARTGAMGEHASQQDTPRLGLRNLARALHEQGIIPDDNMQALGAFVADALGLSIDACM